MTKLSPELYKLLNKNDHFSELPIDHPDVIAVQERCEMEILDMERKRHLLEQLEIREMLGGINRTNLTPMMYYHLANKGVTSERIFSQMRVSTWKWNKWKKEKQLKLEDIYIFSIYDTEENVYLQSFNTSDQSFNTSAQVGNYLDVSYNLIYQAIKTGNLIRGRYQIERSAKFDPTLEEAMDFEVEDTFQWWLDHGNIEVSV